VRDEVAVKVTKATVVVACRVPVQVAAEITLSLHMEMSQ